MRGGAESMPESAYRAAWQRALRDPEGFWGERAAALTWERRWERVLDASRAPFYRWFVGGRLNTCYSALAAQGVARGDRVIIYMPMVPEAVVAMLACARIGAVHSVVFGGFAPLELATRIEDATP